MSLDDNKRLALRFMEALGAGRFDEVDELMVEDFSYWVAGSTIVSGHRTKAEAIEMAKGIHQFADGPLKFTIAEVTAEGDRVAVEATSYMKLKSGVEYGNAYMMLFKVRDGRIAALREHMDTEYFSSIFPRQASV